MGHGESTHGLYAGGARLPSGIDFHIFFQTMHTSGIWHELLGFLPTLSSAMNATSLNQHHSEPTGSRQEPISSTEMSTAQLLDLIRGTLLPDVQRLVNQTRADDIAALLHSINVKPQPSTVFRNACKTRLSSSQLLDLRKFLGDPQATFKTPQQAEVMAALASNEPSLMVIGPTGLYTCS